jgi:hypothetical protein
LIVTFTIARLHDYTKSSRVSENSKRQCQPAQPNQQTKTML